MITRRGFLGALVAVLAAPRLLAKLAPAAPVARIDSFTDWVEAGGDVQWYTSGPSNAEWDTHLAHSWLEPMRYYDDPELEALLRDAQRRVALAPTGFGSWERRVLG